MASEDFRLDPHGELYQANSGAVRFKVKSTRGWAHLALCGIEPPHKQHYCILLGDGSRIIDVESQTEHQCETASVNYDFTMQFIEFWLTWFNGEIRLGHGELTTPFLTYEYQRCKRDMIGYIRLGTDHYTDWIFESSPIISNPVQYKKINGGELRWVTLNNHRLPHDALIGGFEEEPIYIALAEHNGSMCPGKYVPSKKQAFIPWGHREHAKQRFKILCGYNATWVQTSGNKIPQNAFIGGTSEVGRGPLYIGRAVYDGHLINGKIHIIYSTCYLPYNGREVEVYSFEVLVLPEMNPRSILADVHCDI